MISVEIELKSPDPGNDIFELKKYLQDNVEGLQIHIMEQPVQQGQMGIGLISTLLTFVPEPVLKGSMEVVTKIAFEGLYEKILKPKIEYWMGQKKAPGLNLEVLSTLSDSNSKIHYTEDSNGKSKVFDNARYAIDTDRTRALLIGVGEFDSSFPSIPPVKGNLEDFYRLLIDKRHIGLPRENIVVSYNETQKEIIKHLLQSSRIENTETLLIYFVGHGHRTDVKKLSLIARDSEKIDDDILSGIDFDFISNKILKSSAAKQKILILDACHSGIATQGEDDMITATDVKGSYILASSPGDEVSYFDKNGQNTYFTGALMDVLKNGIENTNDMLALEDLYDYAKDHLSQKNFPHPITKNELNIPPSNFFIARNPLFSADKLKQRATKLFKERKLEQALDEYRQLIKQYPDDIQLRKEFEDCETELSFNRLVEEANKYFYQYQDYGTASELYRKAFRLKSDGSVQEKIRECNARLNPREADPIEEVKEDYNYKEYARSIVRKDDKSALLHLKEVQKKFPTNKHVSEQLGLLETKTKVVPDNRLPEYERLMKAGQFQDALQLVQQQLKINPSDATWKRLKLETEERIEKLKGPGKTWTGKKMIQLVISIVTLTISFFWFRSSKHSGDGLSYSQLSAMLYADTVKTIPMLVNLEKDNDSASLLLGNYYRNRKDYALAENYFSHAEKIPRAKTRIGEMYWLNLLTDDSKYTKAIEYFKAADNLGADTLAWYYLGSGGEKIYTDELADSSKSYHSDERGEEGWNEGLKWFQKGEAEGSIFCKDALAYMYGKKARVLSNKSQYNQAMPWMEKAYAIYTGNGWYQYTNYTRAIEAVEDLGNLYNFPSQGDLVKARKLYQIAAARNNLQGMCNYASMCVRGEGGEANCTDAFNTLIRAKGVNSKYGTLYGNLGWIYENGCGTSVDKDIDLAKKYYQTGADLNNEYCKQQLVRLQNNIFRVR